MAGILTSIQTNSLDFDLLFGDILQNKKIEAGDVIELTEAIVVDVEAGCRDWLALMKKRAESIRLLKKELDRINVYPICNWMYDINEEPEQTGTKEEMISGTIEFLDKQFESAYVHYNVNRPLGYVKHSFYDTFTLIAKFHQMMKHAKTHEDAMFAFGRLLDLLQTFVQNVAMDDNDKRVAKKQKKEAKKKARREDSSDDDE